MTLKRTCFEHSKIKDLGRLKSILGVSISYNKALRTSSMNQPRDAREVVEIFGIKTCKTNKAPMTAICTTDTNSEPFERPDVYM